MPRLVKEEVVQKMDAFHLFPYHLGPSINVLHKRLSIACVFVFIFSDWCIMKFALF